MQLPLQIVFRHMDQSDEIEAIVREKAAALDHIAPHMISCRVVLEPAGRQREHGNQYSVHLDLKVAGSEIAVTREPGEHPEYRDVRVALRDAFGAARRQLEDFARRQRGDVKTHETAPHARVVQLNPLSDYGFLQTPDGRELYFHRHSLVGDTFDQLDLDTEVTFVEADQPGERGPQASTVRIVGQPRRRPPRSES